MPDPPAEDPLAALREHVRHAHAAAERLAFDAAGAAGIPGGSRSHSASPGSTATPPSGWAATDPPSEVGGELRALVDLVESLRGLLPLELRDQLNEIVRQILLLLRATIDLLVARMQRDTPVTPAEVQDIPIH